MQYTIRNLPKHLDRAIRERARRENKSLNEVALEALLRAFGLQGEQPVVRDLSDIVGTWREDPEMDKAFEDQRRVDPELWR
jgi:plasmid stability protein